MPLLKLENRSSLFERVSAEACVTIPRHPILNQTFNLTHFNYTTHQGLSMHPQLDPVPPSLDVEATLSGLWQVDWA